MYIFVLGVLLYMIMCYHELKYQLELYCLVSRNTGHFELLPTSVGRTLLIRYILHIEVFNSTTVIKFVGVLLHICQQCLNWSILLPITTEFVVVVSWVFSDQIYNLYSDQFVLPFFTGQVTYIQTPLAINDSSYVLWEMGCLCICAYVATSKIIHVFKLFYIFYSKQHPLG